jgi:hypothetical protein
MKVRFLENTNIRQSINDLAIPPLGVIFGGVELEVNDQLFAGMAIDNENQYFMCKNGFYYWKGKAVILYRTLPDTESESDTPLILEKEKTKEETKEYPQYEDALVIPPAEPTKLPSETKPIFEPIIIPFEPKQASISPEFTRWGISDNFWTTHQLLGDGIQIGLLDIGVDAQHPDLSAAITDYQDFSITLATSLESKNQIGTQSALLIAGRGNQSYYGVAPKSKLIVASISNPFHQETTSKFTEALTWLLNQKVEIVLMNISYTEAQLPKEQKNNLAQLLHTSAQNGVLFIAPVGESYSFTPENRFPAGFPTCFAVGSHNSSYQRSSNSIKSSALDMLAPEFQWNQQPSTSLSAAYLTGVVALLLEYQKKRKIPFSTTTFFEMLRRTAFNPSNTKSIDYGHGIFQPVAALKAIVA